LHLHKINGGFTDR